jgi:hypothetical protein
MLVEQHMTVMMDAAGMTVAMVDTMTTVNDLLEHVKAMARWRP